MTSFANPNAIRPPPQTHDVTDEAGKLSQPWVDFMRRMARAAGENGFQVGDYKQSWAAHEVGNWLLCDGRSVPVTDYPVLYATIGLAYGGGAGTFGLPNIAPVTSGGSPGAPVATYTFIKAV